MKPILRRIQTLERRLPPPAPASAVWLTAEELRGELARVGYVRGEQESVLATFARFLGLTERELCTRLQRRAAGLPA